MFASLVRGWASGDTTLSRTIFRAVSEQFQITFRAVSEQFQSSFGAIFRIQIFLKCFNLREVAERNDRNAGRIDGEECQSLVFFKHAWFAEVGRNANRSAHFKQPKTAKTNPKQKKKRPPPPSALVNRHNPNR